MKVDIRYTVIIPVYNEQAVIYETYSRLKMIMNSVGESYELLFVNDGSTDRTASIIQGFAGEDSHVNLLDFSRNFGHQIAITAGMDYAQGDAIIIIDADLQDPPELIPLMIKKWREGYDVVYGKRILREGETYFKKITAAAFYRVLRTMTDIDIPLDTGDFRLIDRKVRDVMLGLREKNRFVRGLISWAGFNQTSVEYTRAERFAGESKYPLKKMIKFSIDGITSFSCKPLKLATYLGLAVSLPSFVYLCAALVKLLSAGDFASGGMVLQACLFLINGLILIMLGIIGEYMGRVFDETKNRPLYILRGQPTALAGEKR